jgi:hypothetical protein
VTKESRQVGLQGPWAIPPLRRQTMDLVTEVAGRDARLVGPTPTASGVSGRQQRKLPASAEDAPAAGPPPTAPGRPDPALAKRGRFNADRMAALRKGSPESSRVGRITEAGSISATGNCGVLKCRRSARISRLPSVRTVSPSLSLTLFRVQKIDCLRPTGRETVLLHSLRADRIRLTPGSGSQRWRPGRGRLQLVR